MSNLAEGAIIALQERVAELEIQVHDENKQVLALENRLADLQRAVQQLILQQQSRGN